MKKRKKLFICAYFSKLLADSFYVFFFHFFGTFYLEKVFRPTKLLIYEPPPPSPPPTLLYVYTQYYIHCKGWLKRRRRWIEQRVVFLKVFFFTQFFGVVFDSKIKWKPNNNVVVAVILTIPVDDVRIMANHRARSVCYREYVTAISW